MNAPNARIKFARMIANCLFSNRKKSAFCTVCLLVLGANASVFAQSDTGWWKNLFKGTQKSMCDSSATEQAALEVPGVMIWEPSGGDLTEELSAPEPIETVEEHPIGSVVEQYDDRIASLDSAWHTEEHALRGFRVQIFSGSLQAAREVRANARKTSGEWPVYLSSMPPNYRVTIGDFRSRWEAQKAQDAWDKAFPMSIVIPIDINLPRLQTGRADQP